MSTDRELLELAAKAVGIPVTPDCHIPSGGLWLFNVDVDRVWSPLHDDGDALRLAVSLRMSVDYDRQHCEALVFGQACVEEAIGPDALASTRRAIVMCAAEIGRAMP